MTDYAKPATVRLSELKNRIRSTDLVPSRVALLDDLDEVFDKFVQKGILSWADLQKCLNNPRHLEDFAKETEISLQYLVLLRRETEGYLPKPFKIKDIEWISSVVTSKIIGEGISDSEALLARCKETGQPEIFATGIGIDGEIVKYLVNLAMLCRVQWVSPTTARMLIVAGYESCQSLASANASELYEALDRVNKQGLFFKGKIGLRDINRLIEAAKYEC